MVNQPTDDIDVPKAASVDELGTEIPVTYVPARNLVIPIYGRGCRETQDASSIFIGVNALDYSGYPDCRPEFIHAFRPQRWQRLKWASKVRD